jgi:hypothetical protein
LHQVLVKKKKHDIVHRFFVIIIGCGLLVDLMKKAVQTKNFTELDIAIKTQVEPMLYNKGEGRMIPIAKLVLLRNRDRSRAKWVSVLKKWLQNRMNKTTQYAGFNNCFL